MGIFDFVKSVGKKLGIGDDEPPAADKLKKELDSYKLVKASTPAKEPVFYTVKKGDNLWKIAEKHYGKGKGAKHTVIFEANKPMLKDPDKIYPGQVLRIPELDKA